MKEVIQVMSFDSMYKSGTPPWDINKPQQAFVDLFNGGKIKGPVLDIGCGTGENALFLADHGLTVTGIDFSRHAINKAILKVARKYICTNLTFRIQDLFQLSTNGSKYKTVIDCGVFHIFNHNWRIKYQEKMYQLLQGNGLLALLVFSDKEPLGIGPPHRISKTIIETIFIEHKWKIESITEEKFEHNFPSKFANAYLAVIRKI